MKLTHLVAMKAIILATALPMAAQADSLWHPASNEQGFTYHPDHFKSTKTRAQVLAEVEAARTGRHASSHHQAAAGGVRQSHPVQKPAGAVCV